MRWWKCRDSPQSVELATEASHNDHRGHRPHFTREETEALETRSDIALKKKSWGWGLRLSSVHQGRLCHRIPSLGVTYCQQPITWPWTRHGTRGLWFFICHSRPWDHMSSELLSRNNISECSVPLPARDSVGRPGLPASRRFYLP